MLSSPVLRKFIKLFIPIAFIILVGGFFIFKSETATKLTRISLSESASIQVGTKSIERIVQTITNDLEYLIEQKAIKEAISSKDRHMSEHLHQDWSAFSRTKGVYDQIRWMDNSGKEVIRVNLNQGQPVVVPDEKLQNKGERYYFTDAIKLNRGEFFISPLDLNIERGKIEQPLKPMIRIGTPVFDDNSQKQGVLLLNYLGQQMLDEYERVMGKAGNRAWLLNRDGYWMKGPSSEMEWGFMYKPQRDSIAQHYPDSWKKMLSASKGQFKDRHGLWTYDTIYPLVEGQKTSTGASEAFSPSRTNIDVQDYSWKLVLLLPEELYNTVIVYTGFKISAVILTLLLVFSYINWRLAKSWVAEKNSEEELRTINLNLEHIVAERTKKLQEALDEIKSLEGILPICSYCHKIRDDEGAWSQMELYITRRSDASFSHGICPDCVKIARKDAGLDK